MYDNIAMLITIILLNTDFIKSEFNPISHCLSILLEHVNNDVGDVPLC